MIPNPITYSLTYYYRDKERMIILDLTKEQHDFLVEYMQLLEDTAYDEQQPALVLERFINVT